MVAGMMGTLRETAKEQPMADEQDRPDEPRDATPPAADPPASDQKPPAENDPAKATIAALIVPTAA